MYISVAVQMNRSIHTPLGFKELPSDMTLIPVYRVMVTNISLPLFRTWPQTSSPLCPSSSVQEESESQRQQEEGQPEGPATSRPLDPPRGDGDEEHGESSKCRSFWTWFTHPVVPGPPPGRTQPIREPDWQQEQPLRYRMHAHGCFSH